MIETFVGNFMVNNTLLAVITIAIIAIAYFLVKTLKYLKKISADLYEILLLNKEAHGLFSDIVSKQRNHCDKPNYRRYQRKPKDAENHNDVEEPNKEDSK